MVHVPVPISFTVVPETVHLPPEAVNVTGLPDAPPVTPVMANGDSTIERLRNAGNVMCCVPWLIDTGSAAVPLVTGLLLLSPL